MNTFRIAYSTDITEFAREFVNVGECSGPKDAVNDLIGRLTEEGHTDVTIHNVEEIMFLLNKHGWNKHGW